MKKKAWIVTGVISLVLIMIAVSVYRQVFAKGPSVSTTALKKEEISSMVLIPGTLKLQEEQIVYPAPEKGVMKELLVKEGQDVKKGTVLVKYQNQQLDLEIEQNKLAIESAKLKLNQVDKKIAQLKKEEKDLTDQIGKSKAKEQLEPQYDQLDMEKKLAELDLKQANLQKNSINQRKSELVIKSTVDGVVLLAQNPADASSAGASLEPIIHIGSLNKIQASGLLSEYDTLKIKIGQTVTLRSDAVPGKEWKGKVEKVALLPEQSQTGLQAGNQAVQFPVTVAITDDIQVLKPGFQVIMEIETEKKEAFILPLEAIHDEGDKPYVYYVEKGKIKKQVIETGITSGEKMEIIKGISESQQVILKGPDNMKAGMEVTVK